MGANLVCTFTEDIVWSFFSHMVNKNEKNNWHKSKIWKFAKLYTTLVETLSRSMHTFREWTCHYFQRRCRLKFFLSYDPMLTKKKTKLVSNQKSKNVKKPGLEIWWKGTFPPNFALLCMTGSEKTGFTDDGRKDDGRPRDDRICCPSSSSRSSHIPHITQKLWAARKLAMKTGGSSMADNEQIFDLFSGCAHV